MPVLTNLFPHTLGSNHTMEWVKSQREEYQKCYEDEKNISTSILRCPGIFELYNKGFFIKQLYDVEFKLIDGMIDYKLGIEDDTVIFHNIKYFPYRDGTLNVVPRISTGYTILSSVELLFLPVPYPDQFEWESSTGLLQTNKSIEVNAQIYLNNYQGEKEKTWKINAGDNIIFVIPLTSDKWVIETEMTKKEKLYWDMHEYVYKGIGKFDGGYMKCPMSLTTYSNMMPSIKKRLNDIFKKLWD